MQILQCRILRHRVLLILNGPMLTDFENILQPGNASPCTYVSGQFMTAHPEKQEVCKELHTPLLMCSGHGITLCQHTSLILTHHENARR